MSQPWSSPLLRSLTTSAASRRLYRSPVPLPRARYRFLERLRVHVLSPHENFDWRRLLQPLSPHHPQRETIARMPKAAYYAVNAGRRPGIYSTWEECEAQVKGYPKASYKKFPTLTQAEQFVGGSATSQPQHEVKRPSDLTSRPSNLSSQVKTRPQSPSLPKINDGSTSTNQQLSQALLDGHTIEDDHLVVWTDGSAVGNGKVGSVGGVGVYWGSIGEAASRNLAEALPGLVQTNNRAELLAMIRAIETCPYPDLPLEIRTDSKYGISCLTIYLPSWLRNNWRTSQGEPVKNKDMIVHLLALLNRRGRSDDNLHVAAGLSGGVRFRHVRGHVGVQGNEEADRLANIGATLPRVPDRTDWLSLADAEREDKAYRARRMGNGAGGPRDGTVVEAPTADRPIDIEVEIDPDWLLTEEEMERLDRTQDF